MYIGDSAKGCRYHIMVKLANSITDAKRNEVIFIYSHRIIKICFFS